MIYPEGLGTWKGTGIPLTCRTLVRDREDRRCERCNGSGQQWHHRRSRGVVRPHRHCPCNGIWLCPTCHRWAHGNPVLARNNGIILERSEELPYELPVLTWAGWRYHLCGGQIEWVNPEPTKNIHPQFYRKERR